MEMITLCSMIDERNPDYGDLRFGSAPFSVVLKPGDIVLSGKKKYKILAASVFVVGCSEYQFILDTFGNPLKLEGVWAWKSFKEDEECSKSVFME